MLLNPFTVLILMGIQFVHCQMVFFILVLGTIKIKLEFGISDTSKDKVLINGMKTNNAWMLISMDWVLVIM